MHVRRLRDADGQSRPARPKRRSNRGSTTTRLRKDFMPGYAGRDRAPSHRLRPTDFYDDVYLNGTFTADVAGCNWTCEHCWSKYGWRGSRLDRRIGGGGGTSPQDPPQLLWGGGGERRAPGRGSRGGRFPY